MLFLKFNAPLFSNIDKPIICTGVIEITHCKDKDNPIDIKRKALVLEVLGAQGLPSSEGMEVPSDSILDAETHQAPHYHPAYTINTIFYGDVCMGCFHDFSK